LSPSWVSREFSLFCKRHFILKKESTAKERGGGEGGREGEGKEGVGKEDKVFTE
jgi:hypothetical protein